MQKEKPSRTSKYLSTATSHSSQDVGVVQDVLASFEIVQCFDRQPVCCLAREKVSFCLRCTVVSGLLSRLTSLAFIIKSDIHSRTQPGSENC